MKLKSRNIWIVFIVVLIDMIGFGILIPIVPRYIETRFGSSEILIGLLIASFSFFQFLFSPILGKLSDHIGRKPIIIFSLAVTTISYIIFAFAPEYWIALLARSIAGMSGGSISTAQAYIADVTEKSDRTKGMGLMGASFGIGFVLGPFIGGIMSTYGYVLTNLTAAAFSLFALILSIVFLEESLTNKTKPVINKSDFLTSLKLNRYLKVLQDDIVGKFLLMFLLVTFSIANTYGILPIYAYRYLYFSDRQIGYIYAVIGLVGIIIQGYLIDKLTKRYGEKALLLSGIFFMAAGLFLVPMIHLYIHFIWLVLVAISFGLALINPTIASIVSKLTSPEKQGEVLGINMSMGSLGRVFGPVWGGFSFKVFGYQYPFWTASLFTFLALIIGILNFINLKKKGLDKKLERG